MPNFNEVTKKEVQLQEEVSKKEIQLTQAELIAVKKITKEEAGEIIEDRLPLGLFLLEDNGIYVGIDNTTGEAWTEEFSQQEECIRWLNGEFEIDELNEQVGKVPG